MIFASLSVDRYKYHRKLVFEVQACDTHYCRFSVCNQIVTKHLGKNVKTAVIWIVVGYSFPEYDEAINGLFQSSVNRATQVHIIDPDPKVFNKVQSLLPDADVFSYRCIQCALNDKEFIGALHASSRATSNFP